MDIMTAGPGLSAAEPSLDAKRTGHAIPKHLLGILRGESSVDRGQRVRRSTAASASFDPRCPSEEHWLIPHLLLGHSI